MEQSKGTSTNRQNGLLEGVARSVSQAAVFILDTQKTRQQLCGKVRPNIGWVQLIRNGMLTSILTSGFVFGTYYKVYYGIGNQHWYAGPCAAFSTSIIKIPISNAMRSMQSGQAPNIFAAAKHIQKTKKWKGLYSGYGVSLLEDLVEFDTRQRLYQSLRQHVSSCEEKAVKSLLGGSLGALSGALTAWVTTPFDTVRTHMAVSKLTENGVEVARRILKEHGIQGLYAGGLLRASASAIKSSMFFLCVETLQI